MLGLSLCDIVISFFYFFLGTWMTPKETGWLWAVGNSASCSAQVCGWKQERFSKKVEKPMHFIIIAFVLTTAIIPLVYETYNPTCGSCFPVVSWDICSTKDEGELCIVRGNEQVQGAVFIILIASSLFALIFCTVAMVWVYLHVKRQEMRNKQYNFRQHNTDNHRESRRIRKILFLYTLSLYFSYIPLFFA
eukprot:6210145-Ditylum_brightwellii.AAC.1